SPSRFTRTEPGPPMPAHVEECPQPIVLAAYHDDALGADRHGPVVAGDRELIPAPDAHPAAREQARLLELPDGGIVVEAAGQGGGEGAVRDRPRFHGLLGPNGSLTAPSGARIVARTGSSKSAPRSGGSRAKLS